MLYELMFGPAMLTPEQMARMAAFSWPLVADVSLGGF